MGRTVFFHLKSYSFDWNTLDDLKDIPIGATIGYNYSDKFEAAEKAGRIEVQRVPKEVQNFNKILKGRINIFASNLDAGYALLNKHFPLNQVQLFTYHPKALKITHLCLAFSKKIERNTRLLKLFNKRLKLMKDSGKFEQFYAASRRGVYYEEIICRYGSTSSKK